jgi:hypothetical protein
MALALRLTPEILESAYEYLRTTPPFRSWGLPHPDQLVFRVMGARDRFGQFRGRFSRKSRAEDYSEIGISAHLVHTTAALLSTMAHEMIHLHQDESGTCGRGQHNKEFQQLACRVCTIHGFDREGFL